MHCYSGFQSARTTPNPGFTVTPFFNAEYLRNGMRYNRGFNVVMR